MPASRSPKPTREPTRAAPPPRVGWLRRGLLIAVPALCVVALVSLPASLLRRFMPPLAAADDFSGTVWHGSAGHVTAAGHDLGAVEWRLHPLSLLGLSLTANVHWVKVGFVADGAVAVSRQGIEVRDFEGDGPIADLREFGVPPEWRGMASFKFTALSAAFRNGGVVPLAAVGDVSVTDLASQQIANGVDLGGYVLHLADAAITPDVDPVAELNDAGGPLQLNATITYSIKERRATLTGTLLPRDEAPPALRDQVETLAQLHPRDSQGRIPLDLEFVL